MRFSLAALLAPAFLAALANARFVMYADEWHPTRPTNPADRAGIDHVVLAFAMANATANFQPKVPISTIRSEFPNAKVMIAVGGWGDDIGFNTISQSDSAITQFASDINTMLTNTGADGVDIDWEYPGGNGADYKQVPNSAKTKQIDAYPKVLAAIRKAIGKKLLSIAVPGKKGDMMGFTQTTGPKIWPSVDYINVMSYDLMNRRDNVTKHHTSIRESEQVIKNYLRIGAPAQKINLGFAYYAKYFTTQGDCGGDPIGCPIVQAEDPVTGKDTLTSGAWTFETFHMKPVDASSLTVSTDGTCGPEKGTKCASGCCSQYGNCGTSPEHCSGACQHAFGTGCTDADVAGSWQKALAKGQFDRKAGGQYYFDKENKLFWTWDTPAIIELKFKHIVRKHRLGGVMAWSLGEDSFDWSHIKAMDAGLRDKRTGPKLPKASGAAQREFSSNSATAQDVPASDSVTAQDAPASGSAPSGGKQSWSEVYVDGTKNGPDGAYNSQPGAPDTYVSPAPSPPVTQPGDLPYSSEYLAASQGGASAGAAPQEAPAAVRTGKNGRMCRLKKKAKTVEQ